MPYEDQVVVDASNPDYIQLTNGLTGVRTFNYHGQTRTHTNCICIHEREPSCRDDGLSPITSRP